MEKMISSKKIKIEKDEVIKSLIIACNNQSPAAIEILLRSDYADPNAVDKETDLTLFQLACQNHDYPTMLRLVDSKGFDRKQIDDITEEKDKSIKQLLQNRVTHLEAIPVIQNQEQEDTDIDQLDFGNLFAPPPLFLFTYLEEFWNQSS